MIFYYIGSRLSSVDKHDRKAKCKLCDIEEMVWPLDDVFMTTKKLFYHNYKPYDVTKYYLDLCKTCFDLKYNSIEEKCSICSEDIYEYHPSFLDNEFNRIKIPFKLFSEKEYQTAVFSHGEYYSDDEEMFEDVSELSDDKKEYICCLDCYTKYSGEQKKEILELSEYYIKNVVNSSSKFENKTYKTLKKKEHIIYESTNSMESRHYYRKQLKSLSIDVRLLDAGLIKKEDYIQIYIGIHKADLKFV